LETQVIESVLEENVARTLFSVMKPSNMIDPDWDSGAILGKDNAFRYQIIKAAKKAVKELDKERSSVEKTEATPPLISYYGKPACPFIMYVHIGDEVEKIIAGTATERRPFCYDPTPAISSLVNKYKNFIGVTANVTSCEIFDATYDFPNHVDKGGITFTIPLTTYATLNVGGNTMILEQYGLYSFDDTNPHNASGVFIMLRFVEDDTYG